MQPTTPPESDSKHSSLQPTSWKQAWDASPGPSTRKDQVLLAIKGFCMGTADIIPGVSGGTVAFITGIYENLLAAINSVNGQVFKYLFSLRLKSVLAEVHFKFLLPLLFGIAFAILSTARLMHYLIVNHPVPTWSLFFGLIGASIVVVGREIKQPLKPDRIAFVAAGAVSAYLIVGMIPVTTPDASWFILLSGMIAICAMILPGISGSFLLLILGKYETVTGAIKHPFDGGNLTLILVFLCGCVVGILAFSRVLKYLLQHYHNWTMCVLTGFMIGAMRKIWPWKETLETTLIRGKEYILRQENVLPTQYDGTFALAVFLCVAGGVLVLVISSRMQKKH